MKKHLSEPGARALTSVKKYAAGTMLLAFLVFLNSCENDVKKVIALTNLRNKPTVEATQMSGFLTDNGHITMRFSTPELRRYDMSREKNIVLPKGVSLIRFTEDGSVICRLSAKYAKFDDAQNRWEARDSVVAVNRKGEVLHTNLLYWDGNARRVYTDDYVRIQTPEATINGKGLESDESFDNYEILRITNSVLYVKGH